MSFTSASSFIASCSFPIGLLTSAMRSLARAKAARSGSQLYGGALACFTSVMRMLSLAGSFLAASVSPSMSFAMVRITAKWNRTRAVSSGGSFSSNILLIASSAVLAASNTRASPLPLALCVNARCNCATANKTSILDPLVA